MTTAFFCRDKEKGFVRSCSSTAMIPSCREKRVPPVSARRLDILSIFASSMVVLVLLDVIGCSSINQQLGPDQKMQRSLDVHKEAARRLEEREIWADYATAQDNLGVTYRMQAERDIEPEQNLQR